MKKKLMTEKEGTTQKNLLQHHNKKWVTFTFHSPSIYKITKLLKKNQLEDSFPAHKHNISATLKQN
jgi:hypothetical protein